MKINEKQIIDFLNNEYPQKNIEKWDHVGFCLKTNNNSKELKILTCLDVNNQTINEAINNNVSLIISFHPFKFGNTWNEIYEYDKSKEMMVDKLKKAKISVFSIHTNFDKHKHGTKYHFIKKLGLDSYVKKTYEFAYKISYKTNINELIKLLKLKLNINSVITNFKKNEVVQYLYIAPGASNVYNFINLFNKDLILITSDIKWHEQQLLNDLGFKFIMIPHKTEDVFVGAIANKIKSKFKSVKIIEHYQDDFWKVY